MIKSLRRLTVTARPRWRLLNMSEKMAPTVVNGQAPKKPGPIYCSTLSGDVVLTSLCLPAKKRHMNTVCTSLATATATLKMLNPNDEIKS